MKQLFLSLALIASAQLANAQAAGSHHSWLFSIGTGAVNTDLNNSQFQAIFRQPQVLKPIANINASVKYFVNSRLALGITAGFYHCSGYSESTSVATPSLAPTASDYQVLYSRVDYLRHTAYVTVEGAYTYCRFKKGNINLYGTAGFGITHTTGYVDDKSDAVYVNWPPYGTCSVGFYGPSVIDENKMTGYLAPIGISGGRNLGWYAELGYGYKGMLNAGLALKL